MIAQRLHHLAVLDACADQGVSPGGFFRFKLNQERNPGTHEQQWDLWSQPYAFASLNLDTGKDDNGNALKRPWDFDFGKVGGSLLTLDASTDARGQANTTDVSLSGKGFDNRV